jgi:hypothetical protein
VYSAASAEQMLVKGNHTELLFGNVI